MMSVKTALREPRPQTGGRVSSRAAFRAWRGGKAVPRPAHSAVLVSKVSGAKFGVRRQAVSRATPLFSALGVRRSQNGGVTAAGQVTLVPPGVARAQTAGWRASVLTSRLPRCARRESGAATRAQRGSCHRRFSYLSPITYYLKKTGAGDSSPTPVFFRCDAYSGCGRSARA